jgi:cytochrome c oxidase cbb3-type subunit 2
MMNSGPLLFLGILFTMATSWLGMIFFPMAQLGGSEQVATDNGFYPQQRPGAAAQGAEVYRANGCYLCHSQQVDQDGYGADPARGWGRRRTIGQDYLWDNPVMLGETRIGPDLANIGGRQTNSLPLLVHLFNPKAATPGSTMPAYPYLFEKRQVDGSPSSDALPLTGNYKTEDGYEIVPRPAALQLVAYLESLHSEEWLFEVPNPTPPKKKKVTGTNAPPSGATGTNVISAAGATNAAPAGTNSPTK